MRYLLFSSLLFLLIFSSPLSAQRGKDGLKNIFSSSVIINEYIRLNTNATAGSTSLTVVNNNLNSNGRFPGPLSPGDLIMIIQMQGAAIRGTPSGPIGLPNDSTWGEILDYSNCGLSEFLPVKSVSGSTIINLDCPLKNNYTLGGNVQVIRVPRYTTLTINNTAIITCDPWDGNVGGVVAVEVKGNTIINNGGKIDVSGKGFRGGLLDNITTYGVNNVSSSYDTLGAEKGEGIAGYQNDFAIYGGMYCKGAPANGGGGGNAQNAGGGGGANGGNPGIWNGHGNPDLSIASWASAWEKEFAGFSTSVSSGGGQGGYSFSSSNQDALSVGPDMAAWGGDRRNKQGGIGGRPLDYSTGRLFMGGGGGAGDQNNGYGGKGGNGGGLIYLMSYGTVSGAGQLTANGSDGDKACCAINFSTGGNDGAGGAGAGGTVVINSVGAISGISISTDGGKGGSQFIHPSIGTVNEAEGPGGGGGGGYIAISNGTITQTANGGANGTTDSDGLTEFPPNGATMGGVGSTNQVVSNFFITVPPKDTVCMGVSATFSATLTGTVPPGTTIEWYDAPIGGNILGSGASFITPPLSVSQTFYVGTCPGTYRDSIIAFVGPDVTVSGSFSVCKGFSTSLNASGADTYTWQPSTGLSNTTGSGIIANPSTNTSYTLVGTALAGCTDTSTFDIIVNPLPVLSASGPASICIGESVSLSVSGASLYFWSPAEGLSSTIGTNTIANPTVSTTYIILGTDGNGCIDTAAVPVNVNVPFVDAGENDSVCLGQTATVSAAGASNYLWNTGATINTFTVTPSQTITYTVSTSSGGCINYDSVKVIVFSNPTAEAGNTASILLGSSTTLAGSGGITYQWSPSNGLSCSDCQNPIASPPSTTLYTLLVTNANGCTDTDTVSVIVDVKCDELFVPNFITPNGDGNNDVLYVLGTCIKTMRFEIYDRWGKKVFESTDLSQGWDGSYKGDLVNKAVFVYYLDVELTNGDKKILQGNITVIR